ncbi:MAG: tetratricopeptide repeat protein [Cyclobacteriaceae bacterium]
MKVLFLIVISLIAWIDPATVRKINTAKSEAENAFKTGDYKTAINRYKYLVDSLGVNEDEVLLNLANAYYLQKDTANAFNKYQSLTSSIKRDISSKANQQLGILANQQGRAQEALNYFKQAIKAEPTNDDARYNYEMLKKKLDEQKKKEEEKQQQNKDKDKKDQQNEDQDKKEEKDKDEQKKDEQNKDQEKKDQEQKQQEQKEQEKKEQEEKEQEEKQKQEEQAKQEQEKKEMQNLDREKLQQMKISEEKARMILEAMKNQEKQYLQQQKRKATKSRDRTKPDW